VRLLIFSDIHGDVKALSRLMDIQADYYFAAGDTVTWARGFDTVGAILKQRGERVYILPGNHESERDILLLSQKYGLHPFHGKTLQINDFLVAGLGYSNPTPFNTPGEYSEQEMARQLQQFGGSEPMILICHCPPKGTPLDRVAPMLHCGSTAVAEFIRSRQPEWFFCGHIHEAEGVHTTIGRTRAVNVGKRGYLLDFDKLQL
jgi:hypothetical protein